MRVLLTIHQGRVVRKWGEKCRRGVMVMMVVKDIVTMVPWALLRWRRNEERGEEKREEREERRGRWST